MLVRNARILTMARGERPRRGRSLGDLAILDRADVRVDGRTITAVGDRINPPAGADIIDAAGRVLMPGFVDCHTHACYAGDRLDEWDLRRAGASYLDILRGGGGIMSTVRAVRDSSLDDLRHGLHRRLLRMLRHGTTTVEVKSGYGLGTAGELRMLRAVSNRAGAPSPLPTTIPTALLAHAIDPERPDFVERTIDETLPAVSAEFPGIAIDAYCETGAWSVDQVMPLLGRARGLGHPLRIHSDQFNSLGMIPHAVALGALSIDHLEAATHAHLDLLGRSETFAVLLPATAFHLGTAYADGRRLIDSGAAIALATNHNPGSAPCLSMPMAIALAVRHNGLAPAEALAAATVNPATLLGLSDRGTIEPGQRADLILLGHRDERMLAYEFGDNPVDIVIAAGRLV